MSAPQNYANHTRIVPLYHYVVLPILAVNFGWSLWDFTAGVTAQAVRASIVALTLILVALFGRVFALRAQDRVIRLEMLLRLRELLPVDQHQRIALLTPAQLIALRFAGDAELPALATRVLDDGITDRNTIKKLVTNWRADDLRV